MLLETAPLEDWYRDYYFEASVDISSSGVEPYTLGELQVLLDIDAQTFTAISFRDSRSAGADNLRSLIAKRAGIEDSDRVLVANGSTEAQLLVLMATLTAGDEVVVVEPAYHSLISIARALGCRVSRWQLRPGCQFRPDLDDLRRLVKPQTRMIVVNFPHNPTGVTLSQAEQTELIEIADRYGCYLFWDGAFEDLVYDAPALPVVSSLYDRGLSFGTLSKSFGLPGLRVGWGIIPPDVVQTAVSVRDYTTLALSPLVEFVAEHALSNPARLLDPRLAMAGKNRDLVREWLRGNRSLIANATPAAGVVVFPGLARVRDTITFCHRLMHHHGVLLVPGDCFGLPGHIRLGFGGTAEDLRRGLNALSTELQQTEEG
jgi:capreomycidine synthase